MLPSPEEIEQIVVTTAEASSHPRTEFGVFLIGFACGNKWAKVPVESKGSVRKDLGMAGLMTLYRIFLDHKRKIECIPEGRETAERREARTNEVERFWNEHYRED